MADVRDLVERLVGDAAEAFYADEHQCFLALSDARSEYRTAATDVLRHHWGVSREATAWFLRRLRSERDSNVRRHMVNALGSYFKRNVDDSDILHALTAVSLDSKESDEVREEARFALELPSMSSEELAERMRANIARFAESLTEQESF